MSLTGRINELANKHRKLDEKIVEEQKRPSADTIRLKRLKQEKLQEEQMQQEELRQEELLQQEPL